jgi:hypothetical protein
MIKRFIIQTIVTVILHLITVLSSYKVLRLLISKKLNNGYELSHQKLRKVIAVIFNILYITLTSNTMYILYRYLNVYMYFPLFIILLSCCLMQWYMAIQETENINKDSEKYKKSVYFHLQGILLIMYNFIEVFNFLILRLLNV